jgi:hypothetical protein
MSRVNEARKEISSFTQDEDEKFFECWARFKDLLIKCPPHGYEKWRLVQFFYQRLSQPNRSMIVDEWRGILELNGRFSLQGFGQIG